MVHDMIIIAALVGCLVFSLSVLMGVGIYLCLHLRIEQLETTVRHLRRRLANLPVFNPPTEEIAPPPLATEVPDYISPYDAYITAHRELWKLQVIGDDDTDYADYLRMTMAENWNQLGPLQRDEAERVTADAWKEV